MTQKIYKTARGTTVDLGSLKLQNENVRAIGNMGVNSRGDRVNDQGQVIDSRQQQLQRQIMRQTRPTDMPVHSSMIDAKQRPAGRPAAETAPVEELATPASTAKGDELPRITESAPLVVKTAESAEVPSTGGGLAGALARSKTAKQELDNTTQPDSDVKPA
jgi:hypothetical protein